MFCGSEYEEFLNNKTGAEKNNIAGDFQDHFVAILEEEQRTTSNAERCQHNENAEDNIFSQRFHIYVSAGFFEYSIPVQQVIDEGRNASCQRHRVKQVAPLISFEDDITEQTEKSDIN